MSVGEVFIRNITNSDFEILTVLIKELGYPSTASKVSERLSKINSNECYKTLIAEVDGKIVGFIGLCKLYAYEYDGAIVRIIALVVKEKYRGKGIGTKLVESAEKWALDEEAIAITLNSGINRKEAHELYKNNGYHVKGYSFSKTLCKSECMEKICNLEKRNLIIVTHGGTLAYIIAWWMNFEPRMLAKAYFSAQPGSISRLQDNNYQQNVLRILNDTSHLSELK